MTPDERALLERMAAATEENNQLLKKMQRRSRWQMWFQIAYWGIILFLSFGAFYLIQPYINSITAGLDLGSGDGSGSGNESFSQELQQGLSQYQL